MTESNKEVVVETLREIAELIIWVDQLEPRFFDFFLEKQVLSKSMSTCTVSWLEMCSCDRGYYFSVVDTVDAGD